MARSQNIVLRHLYLLLGYNSSEKFFHVTPDRLRISTVFNVFLANLPQLLDQNHLMGWTMLPVVLQVLLYSPNPNTNVLPSAESMQNASYTYSLWYLEAHVRRNWLMAVIVVLYKYQYTQAPYNQNINSLVRIVLNSLESQFHQCKRIPATVMMDCPAPSRSRDISQPSLGPDSQKDGQETPPTSPIFMGESSNHSSSNLRPKPTFPTKNAFRKHADSSLDADDTESELVAIPESDISDSTLHGSSAPGSFDDPFHFEEICTPLKPEILKNRASAHVTTANLATAHVAMSTLATAEHRNETVTKKTHKTTTVIKTNGDNLRKTTTLETTIVKLQPAVKEVVKAPNSSERAILNPPVSVQRAVVITQNNSPSKVEMKEELKPENIDLGKSSETQSLSWVEHRMSSPAPRHLGRQKRIIDPSITPASTPTSVTGGGTSPMSNSEKLKKNYKSFDSNHEYGSPESPLSKMNVMTPPSSDTGDGLLSPKSVQQLEIPTPERLLPIGQLGKEGIAVLAERVREALTIPNISHLKQDSLEISEASIKDDNSRSTSPRKLIKQTALVDSPPSNQAETPHSTILRSVSHDPKDKTLKPEQFRTQRQRLRKVGPFAIDSIQIPDNRIKFAGSWQPSNLKPDDSEAEDEKSQSGTESRQGSTRVGENCVVDRCSECGAVREEYSDEEIGIMIIILGTFIHREPQLAAPFLPEILMAVSKFAMQFTFPWQCESTTHLPGGSQSVAHQFLRCVLHQLAPNGVFVQIFLTQAPGRKCLKFNSTFIYWNFLFI